MMSVETAIVMVERRLNERHETPEICQAWAVVANAARQANAIAEELEQLHADRERWEDALGVA